MSDGDRCRMGRSPLQNDDYGDDEDEDENVTNDDDDDDDDDDDIGREFFSPAPISLTGNYWPRFFLTQTFTSLQ